MENSKFERLNVMGEVMGRPNPAQGASGMSQVVEVKYPNSKPGAKTYSYIGSGNLRKDQQVDAPVTNKYSGKNHTVPRSTIVATHKIAGAQVGDNVGVTGNKVHSIPTGLKYLAGNAETQRNDTINIRGEKTTVGDYMSQFNNKMQKTNLYGEVAK